MEDTPLQKVDIVVENNHFFINGKKYVDCNYFEQKFFNNFIIQNKELVNRILYVEPKDVELYKLKN